MRDAVFLAAAALLALAGPAAAADAAKGEVLHKVCLSCHGTAVYLPPKRKVESLKALKKEVERWNDMYNPKMSRAEIEDLVAYLNRDFYKFPQ